MCNKRDVWGGVQWLKQLEHNSEECVLIWLRWAKPALHHGLWKKKKKSISHINKVLFISVSTGRCAYVNIACKSNNVVFHHNSEWLHLCNQVLVYICGGGELKKKHWQGILWFYLHFNKQINASGPKVRVPYPTQIYFYLSNKYRPINLLSQKQKKTPSAWNFSSKKKKKIKKLKHCWEFLGRQRATEEGGEQTSHFTQCPFLNNGSKSRTASWPPLEVELKISLTLCLPLHPTTATTREGQRDHRRHRCCCCCSPGAPPSLSPPEH